MSDISSLAMPGSVDLQEVYRLAQEKFRQVGNWVEFYREVFGVKGLLRQVFPIPQQYHEFQKTQEYVEIQRMLTQLRKRSAPVRDEETKVITVRIPKSLYDALHHEADEHHTSLNKYCISKLLQLLDSRVFPPEEQAGKKEEKEPSMGGYF